LRWFVSVVSEKFFFKGFTKKKNCLELFLVSVVFNSI
jgi:hypothetical protein